MLKYGRIVILNIIGFQIINWIDEILNDVSWYVIWRCVNDEIFDNVWFKDVLYKDVLFEDVWFKDVLFEDVWFKDVLYKDVIFEDCCILCCVVA